MESRLRRFVVDAGHELRTPPTSIQGFAQLACAVPPPQRREADAQVARKAECMNVLVGSVCRGTRSDQTIQMVHGMDGRLPALLRALRFVAGDLQADVGVHVGGVGGAGGPTSGTERAFAQGVEGGAGCTLGVRASVMWVWGGQVGR